MDQVQRFVETLDKLITAEDIVVNLEGCLGCGMCGTACSWYSATGDSRLHPKNRSDFIRSIYRRYLTPSGKALNKLKSTDLNILKDLKDNMDVYWKCTLCGRCTLACPLGISNRKLYRMARAAYTESNLSPANPTINAIIENTKMKKHSYGLDKEDILGKIGLFLKYKGLEAPINVKGAENLFICPAAGNTTIANIAIKVIEILNAGDVDYTISSEVIDTGTDIDHIVVKRDLAKEMLINIEMEADRLEVKNVVIAECGCDIRTFCVEVSEVLGRPFKYPVVSIDKIFERLISSGKIPVSPIDASVTFHDPCYISRLSGISEIYRVMLNKLTRDFREMTPNRQHNYCCNGGSGGLRLPENEDLRRKASKSKALQIKQTEADIVTTPCAICYRTLKDITEFYGLKANVRMFFEVIYDAMIKALNEENREDCVSLPYVFKKNPHMLKDHSFANYLDQFSKHPYFQAYLDKFRKDSSVLNFAAENDCFMEYLNSWGLTVRTASI